MVFFKNPPVEGSVNSTEQKTRGFSYIDDQEFHLERSINYGSGSYPGIFVVIEKIVVKHGTYVVGSISLNFIKYRIEHLWNLWSFSVPVRIRIRKLIQIRILNTTQSPR